MRLFGSQLLLIGVLQRVCKDSPTRAAMVRFSTVLIIGQIIVTIVNTLAMDHGFLVLVRWWVDCHWSTGISTACTALCSLIPAINDQATWTRLCNASASKILLLVHRWHTTIVIAPSPSLLYFTPHFALLVDQNTWQLLVFTMSAHSPPWQTFSHPLPRSFYILCNTISWLSYGLMYQEMRTSHMWWVRELKNEHDRYWVVGTCHG